MVKSTYHRTINGAEVDVYDILTAYGVTCPARAHAIKKLLMAGQRGDKSEELDVQEAGQSILRAIALHVGTVAPDPLAHSNARAARVGSDAVRAEIDSLGGLREAMQRADATE